MIEIIDDVYTEYRVATFKNDNWCPPTNHTIQ